MEPEEYITKRLDDQIQWYSRKSQLNQKLYKWLRVLELMAAASIPFLTGYSYINNEIINFTVGLLGLMIAVITGIISLYKFQENWVEYRTTCESLKHEKYLFLTAVAPYNSEESFPLLVQRVESLISKENSNWAQYIQQPVQQDKDN